MLSAETRGETLMHRIVAVVLALAASLALAPPAVAQGYPDRPVKIVVGAPPGGGLDVITRAVAQELTIRWGKPVIVENRPGASGTIAAEAVSKSPPDGYTLMAVTDQIFLATRYAYKNLPYDPDSFVSISLMAWTDQLVLAHVDVAARDIRELVALEKSKPGSLAYGSYGEGTMPQLLYETLNKTTGTKFLHVPYKGVAPVLNALTTNEVQLSVISAGTAAPLLRSGKVKPLAIAAKTRAAAYPDLPTTTEAGFPLLQAFIWFGMTAPAGTPRAIVEKASADIQAIVKEPAFAERFVTSLGWRVVASTPAQMEATIREQLPVVRQLIENAGVQPQ